MRVRENDKGWGKYTYTLEIEAGSSGPQGEYAFHFVRGARHIIARTSRGEWQKIYLAHVTPSSLIVVSFTEERLKKVADRHKVTVSSGYSVHTLSGPKQNQIAFVSELGRLWDQIVPQYVCVALL
jgi:hypothetical protein